MELGGVSSDDNTSSKEPPKKELQEPKQSINTLLQRQAKFLETCREVQGKLYIVTGTGQVPGNLLQGQCRL